MRNLLVSNYRKNLLYLFRNDPILAHRINKLFSEIADKIEGLPGTTFSKVLEGKSSPQAPIIPIRNLTLSISSKGLPTAFVISGNKRIHLHSAFDPEAEARKLFGEIEYSENTELVLLGIGLGYGLKEILKKGKPRAIVVAEWSLEVFFSFLLINDLQSLLKDIPTLFIVSEKPSNFREKLKKIKGEEVAILSYFPSYSINPPYYEALVDVLREIVYFRKSTRTTLEKLGTKFLLNILSNIYRGKTLKGFYAEHPIVITGASPGLKKALNIGANLLRNYTIMATDVSVPLLLKSGIMPDVIVSVDPNPQVLLPLEFLKKTLAFCENSSLPSGWLRQRIDEYHENNELVVPRIGPSTSYPLLNFFFSPGDPLTESLAPEALKIEPSGNVGATAFDLAVESGTPVILLVGIDFAFPSLLEHYPPGVALEEVFLANSNLLFSYHNFNFNLSFQGTPIKTENGWEHTNFEVYRTWFRKRLKEVKNTQIVQINMWDSEEVILKKLRSSLPGEKPKEPFQIDYRKLDFEETIKIPEEALKFFRVYNSTEKLAYIEEKLSKLSESLSPGG